MECRITASALALAGVLVSHNGKVQALRAEACELSEPDFVRALHALDGETLILNDGRELRLIGAKPAPPMRRQPENEGKRSYAEAARNALDAMAAGQTLELRFGGERADRYGRVLAHAFVRRDGERIWLQGALIGQGHARVYSFADNHACVEEMLAREKRARQRRLGLWRTDAFGVRSAEEVSRLFRLRQTFQIVEGVVHAVGSGRSRIYLNFAEDWRSDFTISIGGRAQRRFEKAGIDLAQLAGAHIRIRGWIEPRNGPAIEATHPAQIEILARPKRPVSPAADSPGSRDI